MPKRRILFLCSRNKWRSPTAEEVFRDHPGVDVDSAGLNPDAVVPLSPEQLDWADVIMVMENTHRDKLKRRFSSHLRGKRVVVLGIPDDFGFMDEKLVAMLITRCTPHLPPA